MKRSGILGAALALCLLAGCGTQVVQPRQTDDLPLEGPTVTCRVVERQDDVLLLAGEGANEVYRLPLGDLPVTGTVEAGSRVEIAYGGVVMETYPAQLGGPTAVRAVEDGYDDLCVLYLGAFEDLLAEDPALSAAIDTVGVDLSRTRLTAGEQGALAWAVSERLGKQLVQGTWQELADEGYIDADALVWEDGCFLSIEEQEESADDAVTFTAELWRSGLGALYFCDCTSSRAADGHWSAYVPGPIAVA